MYKYKMIKQYSTQNLITLDSVLQKLVCRLCHQPYSNNPDLQSKSDKIYLLKKLLVQINHNFFSSKLSQIYDYENTLKAICDYYSEYKDQQIKKLFIIQNNYKNKFIHILQLVMDLAFGSHQKDNYLNQILKMEQRQKQVLMAYINEVMKRQFIQKQSEMYDSLLQIKEQQYQQLRDSFEELYRNYYQLLQNHNSMKLTNEKILKQNNQLLKQKEELMNELGIQNCHSFLQIAQKYNNDMTDYQTFIQKLSNQLQSKNAAIKSKDDQIKQMNASISNLGQSSAELQEVYRKNRELEELLINIVEKESKAKQQIDRNQTYIQTLKKQIQEKDFQIMEFSRFKQKYEQLKQTHFAFKRNFIAKTKYDA